MILKMQQIHRNKNRGFLFTYYIGACNHLLITSTAHICQLLSTADMICVKFNYLFIFFVGKKGTQSLSRNRGLFRTGGMKPGGRRKMWNGQNHKNGPNFKKSGKKNGWKNKKKNMNNAKKKNKNRNNKNNKKMSKNKNKNKRYFNRKGIKQIKSKKLA